MGENIKHNLEALEKYARILLDTHDTVTLGQVSYLLRVVAEIAEAARREEILLAMLEQKGA